MYERMIAVTNRHLCIGGTERFLEQLDCVAALHPRAIVLREKDLTEDEYIRLAKDVISICRAHGTKLFLHNFVGAAAALDYPYIHLPLSVLRAHNAPSGSSALSRFQLKETGTSVHSPEDAREAVRLGAGYLFAGNIYETDCKKGLPGRGLAFLRQVCSESPVPVYGIGGVTPERLPALIEAGAAGGCMMSGFMKLPPAPSCPEEAPRPSW